MSRPLAALTGGTGFLGRTVAQALDRAGWQIRLLVRRYPVHEQFRDIDVELVPGGLEDEAALRRLVAGAGLVVHAAGLTKAVDRAQFFAVNEGGSARLGAAIRQAAPAARTIVLSSLAAREPSLSSYAASKRAGEAALHAAGLANPPIILRPTAIYGPWDAELLPFFRAAARGVVPLPGRRPARVTLIHVEDAAAAVAACAGLGGRPGVWEISDARSEG
jgi:nucleoside-diphosphate-sugar epimerase